MAAPTHSELRIIAKRDCPQRRCRDEKSNLFPLTLITIVKNGYRPTRSADASVPMPKASEPCFVNTPDTLVFAEPPLNRLDDMEYLAKECAFAGVFMGTSFDNMPFSDSPVLAEFVTQGVAPIACNSHTNVAAGDPLVVLPFCSLTSHTSRFSNESEPRLTGNTGPVTADDDVNFNLYGVAGFGLTDMRAGLEVVSVYLV